MSHISPEFEELRERNRDAHGRFGAYVHAEAGGGTSALPGSEFDSRLNARVIVGTSQPRRIRSAQKFSAALAALGVAATLSACGGFNSAKCVDDAFYESNSDQCTAAYINEDPALMKAIEEQEAAANAEIEANEAKAEAEQKDAAEQARVEHQEYLKTAEGKAEVAAAEELVATKLAELEAAQNTKNEADAVVSDLDAKVNEKQAALDAAWAAYNEEVNRTGDAFNPKHDIAKAAEEEVSAAIGALKEAQDAVTAAEEALQEAQRAHTSAARDADNLQLPPSERF